MSSSRTKSRSSSGSDQRQKKDERLRRLDSELAEVRLERVNSSRSMSSRTSDSHRRPRNSAGRSSASPSQSTRPRFVDPPPPPPPPRGRSPSSRSGPPPPRTESSSQLRRTPSIGPRTASNSRLPPVSAARPGPPTGQRPAPPRQTPSNVPRPQQPSPPPQAPRTAAPPQQPRSLAPLPPAPPRPTPDPQLTTTGSFSAPLSSAGSFAVPPGYTLVPTAAITPGGIGAPPSLYGGGFPATPSNLGSIYGTHPSLYGTALPAATPGSFYGGAIPPLSSYGSFHGVNALQGSLYNNLGSSGYGPGATSAATIIPPPSMYMAPGSLYAPAPGYGMDPFSSSIYAGGGAGGWNGGPPSRTASSMSLRRGNSAIGSGKWSMGDDEDEIKYIILDKGDKVREASVIVVGANGEQVSGKNKNIIVLHTGGSHDNRSPTPVSLPVNARGTGRGDPPSQPRASSKTAPAAIRGSNGRPATAGIKASGGSETAAAKSSASKGESSKAAAARTSSKKSFSSVERSRHKVK